MRAPLFPLSADHYARRRLLAVATIEEQHGRHSVVLVHRFFIVDRMSLMPLSGTMLPAAGTSARTG